MATARTSTFPRQSKKQGNLSYQKKKLPLIKKVSKIVAPNQHFLIFFSPVKAISQYKVIGKCSGKCFPNNSLNNLKHPKMFYEKILDIVNR